MLNANLGFFPTKSHGKQRGNVRILSCFSIVSREDGATSSDKSMIC